VLLCFNSGALSSGESIRRQSVEGGVDPTAARLRICVGFVSLGKRPLVAGVEACGAGGWSDDRACS
jgi:hypothetical protein